MPGSESQSVPHDFPLAEQTRLVARAGTLLLGSGTSSYRVQRAMQRMSSRIGLDLVTAQVALTGMVLTARGGGRSHTEIATTPRLHVNADRIHRLEHLVRDVPLGTTDAELARMIDSEERILPLHGRAGVVAGVALASAAFAYLNNGGPVECFSAAVAGAVGQTARGSLAHRHVNVFALMSIVATVAATTYLLTVDLLNLFRDETVNPSAGYISAVLFLVPGFPLVTAALDLVKLEVLAGISRLTYACVLLVSAALGLVLVSSVAGLDALPVAAAASGVDWLHLAALGVASACGVLGFAVLFNSPWWIAGLAVTAGTLGNVVRLGLRDSGVALAAATLVGAILVGLISAVIAHRFDVPRIILTIPGAIVMVPGNPAFTTLERLADGEILAALDSGLLTVFVVGAIAVGLGIARMLTDRDWAFDG